MSDAEAPIDMAALAERLRARREALGLSKSGLSARAGLSRGHVEQIENMRTRGVEAATIAALAVALGCDPADLLPPPPKATTTRVVEHDDPYPHRATALLALRGLVDDETLEYIATRRNEGGDLESPRAWIALATDFQRLRNETRGALATTSAPPLPLPPDISEAALAARAAKRKRR